MIELEVMIEFVAPAEAGVQRNGNDRTLADGCWIPACAEMTTATACAGMTAEGARCLVGERGLELASAVRS
jgi:hypothetical protein